MAETTNRGYTYPQATADTNIATHFQTLANDIDADVEAVDAKHVTRVATATPLSADSSTWTSTESGALQSVTAALVSGEKYRVTLSSAMSTDAVTYPINAAASVEASILRIREDSATGTQMAGQQIPIPTTSTLGYLVTAVAEYTAVSTGNKTFAVTGQRNSGSGNHRVRAAVGRLTVLTVDHIHA